MTQKRCSNEMPERMRRLHADADDLRCDRDEGHEGMCWVTFVGGYRTSWNPSWLATAASLHTEASATVTTDASEDSS